MILVLETNGGWLHVFDSVADAELELEATDIENAEYEICNHEGQKYVGMIIVERAERGWLRREKEKVRLRPEGNLDKTLVASILARAADIGHGNKEIKSLGDLRKTLEASTS